MNDEPFLEVIDHFVLDATPRLWPTGGFQASVVICREGSPFVIASLTPDVVPFATSDDAAEFALMVGRRWIDRYGNLLR
jgi:hypothetical protein